MRTCAAIVCVNHGGPIGASRLFQIRKKTWRHQVSMKLSGLLEWVLHRVCSPHLVQITHEIVILMILKDIL